MATIKFNSSTMAECCKVFGKVISGKVPMPILETIKFSSSQPLTIMASNNDILISKRLPSNCGKLNKDVCIPFKWLNDLCESNPCATIHLTIGENYELKAETIDGVTLGRGQDASPFPEFKMLKPEASYTLNGADLLDAISKVQFACAKDEARLMMTGVYLDGKEDKTMNVVATDGRILAKKSIYASEATDLHAVFGKRVTDVLAAIEPGELSLGGYEDYYYRAYAEGYCVEFKALEGEYPRYDAVIPPLDKAERGRCSRHGLLAALKRVSAFGNSSSTLSRWTFGSGLEGGLQLESHDFDYSTSVKEVLPCFTSHKTTMSIGLSSTFATMVLQRLTGNTICAYTSGEGRPVSFVGADETLLLMMMPMLLDEAPKEVTIPEPEVVEGGEEDEMLTELESEDGVDDELMTELESEYDNE